MRVSLFSQDERFLHHIVIASGTSRWMANDVFGYRGIATSDAVENLVESDFRSFRFAMFAAANEALRLKQRRFVDKYNVGLLGIRL